MTWYTLYERNPTSGNDENGWNLRQHVPVSAYNFGAPPSGTAVRVTFRAAVEGNLNMVSAFVGHVNPASGDTIDFDGTQVSLGTNISIPAGTTALPFQATYAFDKTKPLLVSVWASFPGTVPKVTDPQIYYCGATEPASQAGVSNATPHFSTPFPPNSNNLKCIFPKIEVDYAEPGGPPVGTVGPAVGQVNPTSNSTVKFRVDWNKGVTGFTAADCDLSLSTVTSTGLIATVTGSDFSYEVTVTGMLTTGNLTLRIPAGSVTSVAGAIPTAAPFQGTIGWDPEIVDLRKPHFHELTMADRDILCVEIRDPFCEQGFNEVLTVPDSGTPGTYPITGVVNNGHGYPRVTCAEIAAVNGHRGGIYITEMVASPVSNGAGGQRIRCTIYSTDLVLLDTEASVPQPQTLITIRKARGTIEANTAYLYNSSWPSGAHPYWHYTIIDATHFDLTYRVKMVSGVWVDDLTLPSTFTNTYQGGGVITFYSGDGQYRTVVHSVAGCPEINGAWIYARSSLTTIDLYNVPWVGPTWTPGTGRCVENALPERSFPRPNPAKGGEMDMCMISGRLAKRHRFVDRRPRGSDYFNRAAAKVAGDYAIRSPATGAITHTITAVYRKISQYSAGYDNDHPGVLAPFTSSKHILYLKLSGNLTSGTHTLVFPAGCNIAPKTFTHSDKTTRFRSVHADHNGHRPGDHKYAYLSQWIPEYGAYGDIAYSDIPNWYLIDDSGTVVWTSPGPPFLRCTATSQEGTGANKNDQYNEGQFKVFQSKEAPIKIANITNSNPGVVTVQDVADMARLTNGDMFLLSDTWNLIIGGMYQVDSMYFTVASKGVDGANKFRLAVAREYPDPDGLPYDYSSALQGLPPGSGAWIGNPNTTASDAWAVNSENKGNWLYKANYKSSRAGTNVYGLDFSAFTGTGVFRIWMPGRGVSDPIHISESRWHRCWKFYTIAMYHQRSGIELDGRFGTTRPVNMKHRPDQPLLQSILPYCLSNYSLNGVKNSLYDAPSETAAGGGYDPWITQTPQLGHGSHHDAGDFDVRLDETWLGYFVTVVQWQFMSATAKSAFAVGYAGIPTCLEAGMDPVVFAGTDALPAPLVETIWGIEPQRISQKTSGPDAGAVIGGVNYGEGVPSRELSSDTTYQCYAWGYDHVVTMKYCAVAAQLAKVLLADGFTALGNTYAASALAAWNFIHPFATGAGEAYTINDTRCDAFYANVMAVARWTPTEWNANKHYDGTNPGANFDDMDHVPKGCAAAAMFNLTGGTVYKAYCDGEYPPGAWAGANVVGAFLYSESVGATSTKVTELRETIPQRCTEYYLPTAEDTTIGYVYSQARGFWDMSWGAPMNWSAQFPTLTVVAIMDDLGHVPTTIFGTGVAQRCRDAMIKTFTLRHGGNQMGICNCNGLGYRHFGESLHLDSRNQGQNLPIGIVSEAWARDIPSFGGFFSVNGNTWFGAVQHPEYDPANISADPDLGARELYPFSHLCWPIWEKLIEFHYAIEHMEYTTQQQLQPAYNGAMYLQSIGDNTAIDDPGTILATKFIENDSFGVHTITGGALPEDKVTGQLVLRLRLHA